MLYLEKFAQGRKEEKEKNHYGQLVAKSCRMI